MNRLTLHYNYSFCDEIKDVILNRFKNNNINLKCMIYTCSLGLMCSVYKNSETDFVVITHRKDRIVKDKLQKEEIIDIFDELTDILLMELL